MMARMLSPRPLPRPSGRCGQGPETVLWLSPYLATSDFIRTGQLGNHGSLLRKRLISMAIQEVRAHLEAGLLGGAVDAGPYASPYHCPNRRNWHVTCS